MAGRAAGAVVERAGAIAGLGTEAVGVRLHRLCLCAGGYLCAAAGVIAPAGVAAAWAAVDRAVWSAAGRERRLYVSQCASA